MGTTLCRSLPPLPLSVPSLPTPLSAAATFHLRFLRFTLLSLTARAWNIPFLCEIGCAFLDLWAMPTQSSEFSLKTALPPGSPPYWNVLSTAYISASMTGVVHTRASVSPRSFVLDLRHMHVHPAPSVCWRLIHQGHGRSALMHVCTGHYTTLSTPPGWGQVLLP